MLKKIIAIVLVASALMFSGCGEASSEGADILAAQNAIDNGNSELAISLILGDQNLTTALVTMSDADKLTLASAYMGEAGFSMTEIVKIALEKGVAGADALDTFKAQVELSTGTDALANVNNALLCYEASSDTVALASNRASDLPELSEATLRMVFALLIKAVLLITAPAPDTTEIAGFLNDVFNYFETNSDLVDLRDQMASLKIDIINKDTAGSTTLIEAIDVAGYVN